MQQLLRLYTPSTSHQIILLTDLSVCYDGTSDGVKDLMKRHRNNPVMNDIRYPDQQVGQQETKLQSDSILGGTGLSKTLFSIDIAPPTAGPILMNLST